MRPFEVEHDDMPVGDNPFAGIIKKVMGPLSLQDRRDGVEGGAEKHGETPAPLDTNPPVHRFDPWPGLDYVLEHCGPAPREPGADHVVKLGKGVQRDTVDFGDL